MKFKGQYQLVNEFEILEVCLYNKITAKLFFFTELILLQFYINVKREQSIPNVQ
jgi:hypothetical protein